MIGWPVLLQLAGTLALENGQWWQDGRFVRETRYVVDGRITPRAPMAAHHRVERIDLAGGYVVPAFGEAHNHNIEPSSRLVPQLARYLADGVFFVANPAILPRQRALLGAHVNAPGAPDVRFSSGGFTGPGGHPLPVIARNVARGAWRNEDGDGAFVHVVRTPQDVARAWPRLMAARPDFVKVYLLYSEQYHRRLADSTAVGWRGIDPALVPAIVRRAHAGGRRVMAHIETAADFRAALAAGVDLIGHMPGFRGDAAVHLPDPAPYRLTAADARAAAQRGTIVVTTLGGAGTLSPAGPDSLTRRALDALHRENLRTLRAAGVRLAIGSDTYADDSRAEAHYLHGLGVFTDSALFRMWAESTPRAIFPERRIGRVEAGDEASFLVLSCNPVRLFACTDSVTLRMKDGQRVSPGAPFRVPQLDLARDSSRLVVVDREAGQYLGHVTTTLLGDGTSMIAVYPKGHGAGEIVLKRSADAGRTWSARLPVPENWATSQEVPTIHRVPDPVKGGHRLILFSGLHPARMASSDDEGRSWTPLAPIGDWGGIVVMGSVLVMRDGSLQAYFHDDGRFFRKGGTATGTFTLYQVRSRDGGRSWDAPRAIWQGDSLHLCEPGAVRSPDGRTIALLLRENRRRAESQVMFTSDEGETWSAPAPLARELTGDRHTVRVATDGRLVVTFRDMAAESPTKGDWVAWVGRWDDLVHGTPGLYRVRLGDNTDSWDSSYPGLERLEDGTFVATTYGYWTAGVPPYIVSTRFTLSTLDAMVGARARR